MPRPIFVTGTDTGVGKTVLTALLLHHLRRSGRRVLAMKPFASGSRADADLLSQLQEHELPMALLNPFFYDLPVAPAVAARQAGCAVRADEAVERIQEVRLRCSILLVEGCGGLMTPLGEGFNAIDIIQSIGAEVLVVAVNRLGVINQTLLTLGALKGVGIESLRVVLMETGQPDASSPTNLEILTELAAPLPVSPLPFLGSGAERAARIQKSWPKVKIALAELLQFRILGSRCSE